MRTAIRGRAILLTLSIWLLGACAPSKPAEGPRRGASQADEPARATIAAVGDLLLHSRIQNVAAAVAAPDSAQSAAVETIIDEVGGIAERFPALGSARQRYAATYAWHLAEVREFLDSADLTFANLENPLAAGLLPPSRACAEDAAAVADDPLFDALVYAGWAENVALPNFNGHPAFAHALAYLGIDLVSTANNHALDRCGAGVDRTLDALEAAGVASVGTARAAEADDGAFPAGRRLAQREVNGITVGILAYTYGTNFGTDEEKASQVSLLERATILADIAAVRGSVDVLLLSLHWGTENNENPRAAQRLSTVSRIDGQDQRALAHELLEAGADGIIGHHPHVLRAVERFETTDGRQTFVAYSLGNFFSGQELPAQNETAVLYIDLEKDATGARLAGLRYLPVYIDVRWAAGIDGRYSGKLRQPVPVDRPAGHVVPGATGTNIENVIGTDAERITLDD